MSLTDVELPDNLKRIESYAFSNCENLENINLNMVYTIASYHDIGHSIDAKNHEKVSAEMLLADEILLEEWLFKKNIARLTNQLWKLIPMRENEENWRKQLDTVTLEVVGLNEIFLSYPQFL